MGQIQRFTDATGEMPLLEQYNYDIDQIIEEMNRSSDQLDALQQSIKIVAQDKVVINYSAGATPYNYPVQVFNYGAGTIGTFWCWVERSDQPGRLHQVPYYDVEPSGALQVIKLGAEAEALQNSIQFRGFATSLLPSPPATLTFHFLVFRQPATVGVGLS